MRNAGRAITLIVALGLVTGCGRTREGNMVDLVLVNGKVWDWRPGPAPGRGRGRPRGQDPRRRDDGRDAELSSSGIKLVDLGGALVLPGFIDSHTHFLHGGFALSSIQLQGRPEPGGIRRPLRGQGPATRAQGLDPQRDLGRGAVRSAELPRREWIDRSTPDNPVFVSRIDLHIVLANSAALRLAGITRDTPPRRAGRSSRIRRRGSRRASSRTRPRTW